MDRASINRQSFKFNFLKTIVMRLDFQGVMDSELEPALTRIKPKLMERGFDRYFKNENNQVDLNLEGQFFEGGSVPIKAIRRESIHSFSNDMKGITFEISKSIICLRVTSSGYYPFEEYVDLFCDVLSAYSSGIDYFTPVRFGLRKINTCILDNFADVSVYFSNDYYNLHNPFADSQILLCENKRHVVNASSKINISTSVQHGTIKEEDTNKDVYKVILDTDIYIDDREKINSALNAVELKKINDSIFAVFIDALSDEMLAVLCGEKDIPDGINGIEENE